MKTEDKLELIKRNIDEVVTEEELKELLKEKDRPIVYWGCACTGQVHVGYFLPMMKIADFLKAGLKVKVLIADLHAALDNVPWDVVEKRYEYYKEIIPLILKSIGVDVENLEFIKGSDFQLKPGYMHDVLELSSYVSIKDTRKASREVVKHGDNPKLSGLIYPVMQALDEQYLRVDIQFGGTDQRNTMMLARENLPKLSYDKRVEIINPLVPSLLEGGKMSASKEKGKIGFLDSEEEVRKKLKQAEMVEGETDNGVMAFLKRVIMTIKKDKGEKFVVERSKKYGGNKEYSNYEEIEGNFKDKELHPLDLKKAVAKEINEMLSIFRKKKNKKKLDKLVKQAYE